MPIYPINDSKNTGKKSLDDINLQQKAPIESPEIAKKLHSESLQNKFSDIDLKSRKIKNIDYFLTANSHDKCCYFASNYLNTVNNLSEKPDATAYKFLKSKQKIPVEYIVYNLFPYLALEYINNDETKLADSLFKVFNTAKELNIKDLSKISFEDIVILKNTLKIEFKQQQQENLKSDAEHISSDTTPSLKQIDNDSSYLDETDISYIKETSTDKLSIKEEVNRIKRFLLKIKYAIFIEIIFSVFSISMFILPNFDLYAQICLLFIVILPIIFFIVNHVKDEIKFRIASGYISENLDNCLEILDSNRELFAEEAKMIRKLREYYSFLLDFVYFPEMCDLYAEIEKSQQEITAATKNSLQTQTKSIKDEIYKLKTKTKIKTKEQDITNFFQLYEKIYYLTMKENEYYTQQFEKLLLPSLERNFYSLPQEKQQQTIDKVLTHKGIAKQKHTIGLLDISTNDETSLNELTPEKKRYKDAVIEGVLNVASFVKDLSKDRIQSSLEYSTKIMLTKVISKENIGNFWDIIKTPITSVHGVYCFVFSIMLDSLGAEFSSYRDKKRMLNIKLGKPETTGLFYGLINPRLRTNREKIATIIDNQKKNSISQLQLMSRHNKNVKKYIKKLQKETIPPEELIKMIITFKFYQIQSTLLATKSTADFLQLFHDKLKELELPDELTQI